MPTGIYIRTNECREILSLAKMGKKHSEEHNKKIGLGNKGKQSSPKSEETKRKMSVARKGIKLSDIHRRRISNAHKKLVLNGTHHLWKGGLTENIYNIRHSVEYKLWREAVFKRDNWTCIWCGLKNGNGKRIILNSDHVKPFALILRQNNITTLEEAINCIELWKIDNGRTLCVECHETTDTYLNRWYREDKIKTINESLNQ